VTIKPFLEFFDWVWSKKKKKQKLNILIVDDNLTDAELLLHCLRYHGYTATVAGTAEAAQALILRDKINLIFVDMRLTYMQGWNLIPIIWRESPDSLCAVLCGEVLDVAKIPQMDDLVIVIKKPATVEIIGKLLARLKM